MVAISRRLLACSFAPLIESRNVDFRWGWLILHVLFQGTETLVYKRGRVLVVGFWSECGVRGAHANQKFGPSLIALKCFDGIIATLDFILAFFFGLLTLGLNENVKNHQGFPCISKTPRRPFFLKGQPHPPIEIQCGF